MVWSHLCARPAAAQAALRLAALCVCHQWVPQHQAVSTAVLTLLCGLQSVLKSCWEPTKEWFSHCRQ